MPKYLKDRILKVAELGHNNPRFKIVWLDNKRGVNVTIDGRGVAHVSHTQGITCDKAALEEAENVLMID